MTWPLYFVILGLLTILFLFWPETWAEKLTTPFWEKLTHIKGLFHSIQKRGPARAQELLLKISIIKGRPQGEVIKKDKEVWPTYKFYTSLIIDIVDLSRQFGIAVARPMTTLQSVIQKDGQWESQLKSKIVSFLAQLAIGSMMVWLLFLAAIYLLEVGNNHWPMLFGIILGVWQGSGVLILLFFAFRKIQVIDGPFQEFLAILIKLRALLPIGLSVSQVSSKLQIAEFFGQNQSESELYLLLKKRFQNAFYLWGQRGQNIEQELTDIFLQLDFLYSQTMNSMDKKLLALKFVGLVLLVLIPYFTLLFGLIFFAFH